MCSTAFMGAILKSKWWIGITVTLTAIGLVLGLIHISFPYRISEFQSRVDNASAIGGLFCSVAAIISASMSKRICGDLSRTTNISLSILRIVAIVGILLSLAVSIHSTGGASKKATLTSLKAIDNAITRYHEDTGVYPTDVEGLEILYNSQHSNWQGPYLSGRLPKDAWGNCFRYRLENEQPTLSSAGPDGIFNTADDIRN